MTTRVKSRFCQNTHENTELPSMARVWFCIRGLKPNQPKDPCLGSSPSPSGWRLVLLGSGPPAPSQRGGAC